MKRTFCLASLTLSMLVSAPAFTQDEPASEYPDPGITSLATEIVSIDMGLEMGRPMIAMMVNGHGPYKFVVDTGASLTLIDTGIAKELGLPVVGVQTLSSPGMQEGVEVDRVRADLLQAGGLRIENPVLATIDIVAMSAGTMQGVLGRPQFRDLLLTYDFPGARFIVTHGKLQTSDPSVVAYDPDAESIRIPVDVAGVELPMVLDTGSPGHITLPKAMLERFPIRGDLQPGGEIRMVGGSHPVWHASLDGDVRLGTLKYENPDVVLTTFAEDFGNIGGGLLKDLRLTLDQANSLIRLERPAPTPGPARIVRRAGPMRAPGSGSRPPIGIRFEMTTAGFIKKDGGLVVNHVDEGGLASQAGLQVSDIVVSLAGTSTTELDTIPAVAKLIQGERPLAIEVMRGDQRLRISIQ